MKKILTIFSILAVVMLSSSCQKELPDDIKNVTVSKGDKTPASEPTPTPTPTPTPEPELKVSEPGQFGAKGGQQTITITATEAWTLSKSDGSDWLNVKTTSGKAGTTQVDLEAAENTLTQPRTAAITVSSGELTKVVELSQSAANSEISLSVDNLNFPSGGDSQSFTIKSNIAWTVSSSQDWCSVSPKSGSGDGSVSVRVDENTSISERTATITVQSEAGDQTVKVIQSGASPELHLNKNDLSFMAAEGNDSFSITSNTSWSITSDQTWCIVSTSSGSDNATVMVNVTENTSTSSRTATITVKAGDLSKTITITQAGANPTLQLNKSSMTFESSNGSISFTITSNTSWSVTSNQTWCKVSTSSGSDNGTITVNVSENTSTSSRTATITVKTGGLSQTFTVTQAGAKPVDESTRTFTANGVSFKMIRVDGGTFTMGATSEQGSDAKSDESPTHRVTLSSYYIGETEVTQALWQAVMGQKPTSNGSQWSSNYGLGGNYPAYYVSWNDCQDFITKLNRLTGQSFRLPTETEWEFAARGGNKSQGYKYAGSNTISNVAWYYDNSYALGSSSSDYGTHAVATKSSNELGLYDMSGNVWEWCQDWKGDYSSSSQTNPTGPSSGSSRVRRGGSWLHNAGDCRVSIRDGSTPDSSYNNLGLRLAL